MREATTGVVDIYVSPPESILPVFQWIYTGKLNFALSNFMNLIYISHQYGIHQLERELRALLATVLSPETILSIIQQCFERQLSDELRLLEPAIARFLESIPIAALSEALDVLTFSRVIEKSSLANEARVNLITGFMGGYDPSREEKRALVQALKREPGLKALLDGKGYNWVPPEFLRALH
jgi:hypothetical protein